MATDPITTRPYFGGRLSAFAPLSGVALSQVEYGEARACPKHTHGRAFFALLLRGGYEERFRTFGLEYRPFRIGFHPEGTQHSDRILAAGTSMFIVELERAWLSRAGVDRPATAEDLRHGDVPTTARALRLWDAFRSGGTAEPVTGEALVLELVSGLLNMHSVERRRPRWLNNVVDLLRSEYSRSLTIMDIARAIDRHPVYLSRTFRQFYGAGIGDYLRGVRIRAALDHLGDTELPLAQVALEAGFSDQSQLTKAVKRATGWTPGRLRRIAIDRSTRAASVRRAGP